MARDSPTDTVRQFKIDLDRMNRDLMPETWAGHGRLTIRESDCIPVDAEEKAIEHLENVLDQNPDYPAETVANKIIKKLTET